MWSYTRDVRDVRDTRDVRDVRYTRDTRAEGAKGWDAPAARKGGKGGTPLPEQGEAARNGQPGRRVGRLGVSQPKNTRDTRKGNFCYTRRAVRAP